MSEAQVPVAIGVRLQERLDGMQQNAAWLAEKAGVERSTVSRVLRGERTPTPDTLALFAPVLGVSLEQLVFGTDASSRVTEAQRMVSRAHYDEAVKQLVEFEQQANRLSLRIAEVESARDRDVEKRKQAEAARETAERERHDARVDAKHHRADADRYKRALEQAVADLASLQSQVNEIAEAAKEGRDNGRVGALLAGVAAVASVAVYLGNEPKATAKSTPRRRPSAQSKAKSRARRQGGRAK